MPPGKGGLAIAYRCYLVNYMLISLQLVLSVQFSSCQLIMFTAVSAK